MLLNSRSFWGNTQSLNQDKIKNSKNVHHGKILLIFTSNEQLLPSLVCRVKWPDQNHRQLPSLHLCKDLPSFGDTVEVTLGARHFVAAEVALRPPDHEGYLTAGVLAAAADTAFVGSHVGDSCVSCLVLVRLPRRNVAFKQLLQLLGAAAAAACFEWGDVCVGNQEYNHF